MSRNPRIDNRRSLHIISQKGIFEGYAPDQAELLKNAVIDIHGNYALYAVKEDAATMNDQFLKALSEGE